VGDTGHLDRSTLKPP